jgi:hypothetical protein
MLRRLAEDWLLIADRNFYNWADWCAAAETGAALLWRVKSDLRLPVLELLPDGSYRSVLVSPKITCDRREQGVLPEVVGLPPGDLIEQVRLGPAVEGCRGQHCVLELLVLPAMESVIGQEPLA